MAEMATYVLFTVHTDDTDTDDDDDDDDDTLIFYSIDTVIFCTSPVLFGVISLTVPNFDGPSATRKECHISLKRRV